MLRYCFAICKIFNFVLETMKILIEKKTEVKAIFKKSLIKFIFFLLIPIGRVMPDSGFLHIGFNAGYARH